MLHGEYKESSVHDGYYKETEGANPMGNALGKRKGSDKIDREIPLLLSCVIQSYTHQNSLLEATRASRGCGVPNVIVLTSLISFLLRVSM